VKSHSDELIARKELGTVTPKIGIMAWASPSRSFHRRATRPEFNAFLH